MSPAAFNLGAALHELVLVNGLKITGAIYQNKDDPNQFYISKPKIAIVDFTFKLMGQWALQAFQPKETPTF
jgi:hypothetical protein